MRRACSRLQHREARGGRVLHADGHVAVRRVGGEREVLRDVEALGGADDALRAADELQVRGARDDAIVCADGGSRVEHRVEVSALCAAREGEVVVCGPRPHRGRPQLRAELHAPRGQRALHIQCGVDDGASRATRDGELRVLDPRGDGIGHQPRGRARGVVDVELRVHSQPRGHRVHLRRGKGAEALVRLVRDTHRHGARLQVKELIGRKQGLHRVRLEAAGRGDAQAGVREDAAHGQQVDACLEAELARGQVGHGGPVGSLELGAQAAAPQRQEIGSVGSRVIDEQGIRRWCPRQGIASIALGFAVAVAIETERGPVAQDGRGAQGRLGEEGPDHSWRKLLQHQGVDAPTLHVPVRGKIPGVQRREVAAGEVLPVTFALAVAVAGQLHRGGVAQNQVRSQGCLGQQRPYHSGREIVEDHRDDASPSGVAVDGMIPGVALRFGEEARGADLAGDLRRGFALLPSSW